MTFIISKIKKYYIDGLTYSSYVIDIILNAYCVPLGICKNVCSVTLLTEADK